MGLIRTIIEVEEEMSIRGVVVEDSIMVKPLETLNLGPILVNPLEMPTLLLNFQVFNHILNSRVVLVFT